MDTQARIEAARARLEAERAVLVRAKTAGPPCVQCLHFIPEKPRNGSPHLKDGPFCAHLAYSRQSFSPIAGTVAASIQVSPDKARSDDGLCGLEGALFERHPKATLAGAVRGAGRWSIWVLSTLGALSILNALGFQ